MPKKGETWSPERRAQYDAQQASRSTAVADAPLLGESEYEPELMSPNGQAAAPVLPTAGADTMSRTEMFRARMAAQGPVRTYEDLAAVAGEGGEFDRSTETPGVEHTSAGLVWLYKHEGWGWERRRFSRNGLSELLIAGLLPYCGDCMSAQCAGEPNACPKGTKYFFRVCPVAGCNKNNGGPRKFYDIGVGTADAAAVSEDPFAIRDDAYAASTPELRTKAMLDEHIRYYHTTEAQVRGLNNIQAPAALTQAR